MVNKRLVFVCSPYRGPKKPVAYKDVEVWVVNEGNAKRYCREIMAKFPEVLPLAPHLYFPGFLSELKEDERAAGIAAGLELLDLCDEIWVFGMDHPSAGMIAEINRALEAGIQIRDGFEVLAGDTLPEREPIGRAEITVRPTEDADIDEDGQITISLPGALVMDMADNLRRARGQDVLVAAEVDAAEEDEEDDE